MKTNALAVCLSNTDPPPVYIQEELVYYGCHLGGNPSGSHTPGEQELLNQLFSPDFGSAFDAIIPQTLAYKLNTL